VTKKQKERVTHIEKQLEAWLEVLANALKASPSLGDALASTTRLVSDPIRSELKLVLKKHQLGTPLDQAFAQVAERIGSRSVESAFLTLRIARNTGGDLSATLRTSASALREMARLDGVVRTKTAEGKAQALVIGIVPVPLYALIRWMDPLFFEPLEHGTVGTMILACAVGLWLAAIVSAQHILRVDV
jgi:tight adherence protein B